MAPCFIQRLRLDGFLSFPPGSDWFELQPLNVLIGPNGAGKSNVIDALELLYALPSDFAAAIREGGGATEWLWKGDNGASAATLDVELGNCATTRRPLRYRMEFAAVQNRAEVLDEAIEDVKPVPGKSDVLFYYRFQRGNPVIRVHEAGSQEGRSSRRLQREALIPDQSVLAQRKDPDLYPEVTWLGRQFGAMQIFRDWNFGRNAPLRRLQGIGLPDDYLLPDASNLALVLNQIEHKDARRFNELLNRFFPRFERMSTRILGVAVQFYLHEPGFSAPIPGTRLSDGTIRFIALLASLLSPALPPLLCIEEPELGLHPDAVAIIADLLMETSARTQIILTTHSETLVSALSNQPDSVIACERPGAGTVLRRLDPKRLTEWLESYRLGDLWRMGELGANP